MARVAILDDYQGVATSLADWSGLDVTVFRDHVADEHAVAERLPPSTSSSRCGSGRRSPASSSNGCRTCAC